MVVPERAAGSFTTWWINVYTGLVSNLGVKTFTHNYISNKTQMFLKSHSITHRFEGKNPLK
jgi:hypothetical protein